MVDYIAIAHSDFMHCSQFSVSGMSDFLRSLNLNRMLHSKCKVYSDCDSFVCCGDLNARIGDSLNYIPDVDSDIPARSILDKQTNQHGRAFVEFLTEAKMCVLNRRCDNNADDFTSIKASGRSVVDYIAIAHSDFMNCSQFSVSGMSDFLRSLNLNRMLHSKCKAPDHLLVMFKLALSHGAKMLSRQENVNLGHVDSECGKVTRR